MAVVETCLGLVWTSSVANRSSAEESAAPGHTQPAAFVEWKRSREVRCSQGRNTQDPEHKAVMDRGAEAGAAPCIASAAAAATVVELATQQQQLDDVVAEDGQVSALQPHTENAKEGVEEDILGLSQQDVLGCCKVLDLFLQDSASAKAEPKLKAVRAKLYGVLKQQKKQFFHGRSEEETQQRKKVQRSKHAHSQQQLSKLTRADAKTQSREAEKQRCLATLLRFQSSGTVFKPSQRQSAADDIGHIQQRVKDADMDGERTDTQEQVDQVPEHTYQKRTLDELAEPEELREDRNFDDLAEKFVKKVYGGHKGEIRLEVLKQDFQKYYFESERKHLESIQHVLDLGGGMGQFSRWLLQQNSTFKVNLCDISATMLRLAEQMSIEEGLVSRMKFCQVAAQEARGEYPLVLCHALLEWLQNPILALKEISNRVQDGGHLSVLFYNRPALVWRNLTSGRLAKIVEGKQTGFGHSLTPYHSFTAQQIRDTLSPLGFEVLCESGVRVFSDNMEPGAEGKTTPEEIQAVELSYRSVEPYRSMARYYHMLLRRSRR